MSKQFSKIVILFIITIVLYFVGIFAINGYYYFKVHRDTNFDVNYTELVHDIREVIEQPQSKNQASLFAKEVDKYVEYVGNGYKIINSSEPKSNYNEKLDFYIGDEVVYTVEVDGVLYLDNDVSKTSFGFVALNILILFVIVLVIYVLIEKIRKCFKKNRD